MKCNLLIKPISFATSLKSSSIDLLLVLALQKTFLQNSMVFASNPKRMRFSVVSISFAETPPSALAIFAAQEKKYEVKNPRFFLILRSRIIVIIEVPDSRTCQCTNWTSKHSDSCPDQLTPPVHLKR